MKKNSKPERIEKKLFKQPKLMLLTKLKGNFLLSIISHITYYANCAKIVTTLFDILC